MDHCGREAVPLRSQAELQQAARVASGDHVGVHSRDMPHLAVENLGRQFGMEQVIDPGTAAAPVGFLHIEELQAGNSLEQAARFVLHPLSMQQMTRVVVGDAQGELPQGAAEGEAVEELADIQHALAELLGRAVV
jgi:hypothetical protein